MKDATKMTKNELLKELEIKTNSTGWCHYSVGITFDCLKTFLEFLADEVEYLNTALLWELHSRLDYAD